ncbi:MAG: hypothetical protein E7662_03815 [Ruminococcaceae bacterium]|nr:hypothetical protein [Oscillospiraceae bacterium]
MTTNTTNCPCCNAENAQVTRESIHKSFVECSVCGRFQYHDFYFNEKSCKDEYAAYFYYANNEYHNENSSFSYFFIGDREEYQKEYALSPECHYITEDEVRAFYPKKFTEKLNKILCEIARRTSYLGEVISFPTEQLISACFIKRYDGANRLLASREIDYQLKKTLRYLNDNNYIKLEYTSQQVNIMLEPEGWKRVDEIQQYQEISSKNVFVAMSFAPEMYETRETIKKAITENGLVPRIMDEIEHNHQIVPEMLYEIRNSRFVIAELTGHNNGAYFEAGYALGVGKEVIQVCNKIKFGEDGHFDVKQINTVMWENQEDLYSRLCARIQATIG